MKPIIFNEDEFQNLEEIGKALFQDTDDPKSINYIRKLNRQPINWFRVAGYLLMPVLVCVALGYYAAINGISGFLIGLIAFVILLLYLLITIKRAIICTVRIYQRYAPDSVRLKCRFEPSCSEYMILAIEKYGLVSGVKKGMNRLKRCNVSGGGFDFP